MTIGSLSIKTWITIIAVVILLVSLNALFWYISPAEIVASVGVENTYLVVFLIAVLGGINSVTGGVLYAALATFAAGGASPLWLGIIGGIGIAIGDLLMFTLFRTGIKAVHEKNSRVTAWVSWLRLKLQRVPTWVEYGGLYVLLGFTPMPNDILMLFMASAGYRYTVVIPLLLTGCITIGLMVSYFGGELLSFV
jgi:hypothetical protein